MILTKLYNQILMEQEQDAVSALIEWIQQSSKIVFLTGYELSFESGLPDLTNPSFNPDIRHFKHDPEVRKEYWKKIKEFYPKVSSATPNEAHDAIYEISLLYNVDCILTQCANGLQQKAGSENVIEIYSSINWVECPNCGKDHSMTEVLSQLENNNELPKCTVCQNDQIKPPISFPGQALPHWEIREAWIKLRECNLLVIVGANLELEPVASFPFQVMQDGGNVVIISEGESPADEYVSAVIYGKPSHILSHITKEIKDKTIVS